MHPSRRSRRGALLLAFALLASAPCALAQRAPASTHEPRVAVDRRVEALSILQALADAREYTTGPSTPYRAAMVAHFSAFASHPAVAATQALRARGINHEAPMHLAMYLDETFHPIRPLASSLPGLERFAGVDFDGYLDAVRRFATDAGLDAFLAAQAPQERAVEQRFRAFLAGRALVGWYDAVFGERARATYRVVPGMVTGLMSYGGYALHADGAQDVVAVVSLDDLDASGLPQPGDLALGLVVHELAHSYTNPMVDAALASLVPTASPSIARAAAAMQRQAYTSPQIVLEESVVRALVVMYMRDQVDEAHGAAQLRDEVSRGFAWTADLVDAFTRARVAHHGRLTQATLADAVRAGFVAFAARPASA